MILSEPVFNSGGVIKIIIFRTLNIYIKLILTY